MFARAGSFHTQSPLGWAVIGGSEDAVRLLLGSGAPIDELQDNETYSMLGWACVLGRTEIARILVKNGAAVTGIAYRCRSLTPLSLAAFQGHTETCKALLDMGADVDRMHGQCTALGHAAFGGHGATVKLLLARGASRAHRSCIPLHIAAHEGNVDALIPLLDGGDANVSRPPVCRTALHIACEEGHLATAAVLLDAGANVNAAMSNGSTPLHYAALYGDEDLVQLLLDRGANVLAARKDGSTPYSAASTSGHGRVRSLLERADKAARAARTCS